jgi:hypothetical protein
MDGLREDYSRLSEDTARRVLRFLKLHQSADAPVDFSVQRAIRQTQDAN